MDLNHGALENLVMNVLWNYSDDFDGVMSVNQVWEKLNQLNTKKKWAYTTVKTILDRLFDKGLINKIKCGKKFNYQMLMPRLEMAEQALKKVALEYFQNDFVEMAKFVRDLAYEEEKNLVNIYK
ncbi:MAG: BlaI/MecI/CopY family transcriptional regulator [Candidatus Gastranaerophilales bacterium]|nr:BlaI/MecI/CopY family transcriptional regulator [Candidatus Gastranaerophilales bacterium]